MSRHIACPKIGDEVTIPGRRINGFVIAIVKRGHRYRPSPQAAWQTWFGVSFVVVADKAGSHHVELEELA